MRLPLLIPAVLFALAASAASGAQSGEPVPAEDVIRQLPPRLLGAQASRTAGSAIIMYNGKGMLDDASVAVVAAEMTEPPASYEMLRAASRDAYHQAIIRKTMREGSFNSSRFPGAVTFFGEYVTNLGYRQTWRLHVPGKRIPVTVAQFGGILDTGIEAEIGREIFGGAVVSASEPKEQP